MRLDNREFKRLVIGVVVADGDELGPTEPPASEMVLGRR